MPRTDPNTNTSAGSKPTTRGRRNDLEVCLAAPSSHAGLWLDRFLGVYNGDGGPEARAALLQPVMRLMQASSAYAGHLARWKAHVDRLVANAEARDATATVDGRMIVGLGTESVLEVGISLHHTYGVPFIPGSALKGLAANFAARALQDAAWAKRSGKSHADLFGTHEQAGCVAFHDALWVPEAPGARLPLDLDVMTVHHADYYQGKSEPPADWDDPNPISFVTARGSYLVVLEGPDAWTDVAMTLLKRALRRDGIGAKTAAGYGRLDLAYTSTLEAAQVAAERAALVAAEQDRRAEQADLDRKRRIEVLLRDLRGNNAANSVTQILNLADDATRHQIALECMKRLDRKIVRNAQREQKPWFITLTAVLSKDPKESS